MRLQKTPKAGRASRMAARTYLQAHLGWLRGFPLGMADSANLEWVCLPQLGSAASPERLHVTRDLIRRTEFARNAARRRFPRALAHTVGDVDEWARRIGGQLDALKAAVHSGESLPSLDRLLQAIAARRSIAARVAALAATRMALEPLIVSLAWVHWHDESGFASALDVLEMHGRSLGDLLARMEQPEGLTLALQCVQLLESRNAAGFVALLADQRCWETPLAHEDFAERLAKPLNRLASGNEIDARLLTEGLDRPEPRLGRDLAGHIATLSTGNEAVRSRQQQLLEFLLPLRRLEEWEEWWRKAAGFEKEARSLMSTCRPPLSYAQQARCRELAERLKAELAPPVTTSWKGISPLLDDICAAADSDAFDALMACLPRLSDKSRSKAGKHQDRSNIAIFLESWAVAFRAPRRGWSVIARLLSAQRRILETVETAEPERHAWFCQYLTQNMIDTWIGAGKPQRLIEPALAALALVIPKAEDWRRYSGPFADHCGWETLIDAIALTENPEVTAGMLTAVPPDNALEGKAWIALVRLSGMDAGTFQALARGWGTDWRERAIVEEFSLLAETPAFASVIADALIGGESKRLFRLVAQSRLSRSLGQPLELHMAEEPSSLPDLGLYPAPLHETLNELARWDANAARAADEILSPDFPRPDCMETELAFLRDAARGADGDRKQALEARARKLERRLCTPAAASPARLDKYRAKLERRLRHARLSKWEESLFARLRSGLEKEIGAPPPDEWLRREEIVAVLTAFAGLNGPFKSLAFRLLKTRCGPPPWDLRQEPANQAFLAALYRKGLATSAWFDGIGARTAKAGPLRVTLDLESDPLEIMRMGEAFQTCLAPGAFNFFSAVANAADVNKRVLYARDDKGTVRARCLLALTDAGHILTFQVYAHAHYEDMEAAVRAYVLELATAMRTSPAARGVIRELVSTGWYDDGPADLTGQLKFLAPGSNLQKTLAALPAPDLVATLQRALAGAPITPPIICALCHTRAFQDRPELIVPLLPFMGDFAAWDAWSASAVLPLIRQSGETGAALALIQSQMAGILSVGAPLQVPFAEEFIALGLPHRALRLIQQTRGAWVKDWRGEGVSRIMVAAKALAELHRPRQALELYRIASEYGSKEASGFIAILESRLGVA